MLIRGPAAVSDHRRASPDGYRIDVDLSKIGGARPPVAPLPEFLDTLTVE